MLTKLSNGSWIEMKGVRAIEPLQSEEVIQGSFRGRVRVDHASGMTFLMANDDAHAQQIANELAAIVNSQQP